MELKLETITPLMAKAYIEVNKDNVKLQERWVNFYLAQMRNGQWLPTGDTIKFDKNGKLRDGQHRMHALVKYGKPLEMGVARGIPTEAFKVLDSGRKRTTADSLQIEGYPNAVNLAAAVKNILLFKSGYYIGEGGGRTVKVQTSNMNVAEFVKKNEEIHEIVKFCYNMWSKFRFMQLSYLVMLYWEFSSKNMNQCDTFFGKYSTGIDLGESNPIRLLREKLLKNSVATAKIGTRDKVALFIKAWNCYRQGKKVNELRLERGYKFPKPL